MEPKNVLFIISHDIGRRFGCYGDGRADTPFVDALASTSVRFENHFCQYPLCGPSRANLFSGCRPPTTGRFDNKPFFEPFRQLNPGFATLPELFRRNGYRTFASGFVYHDRDDNPSWSEGHFRPRFENRLSGPAAAIPAEDAGYWLLDSSRRLIEERVAKLIERGFPSESISDPTVFRRARGPIAESADVDDDAYYDGKVTERAVRFLRQQGGEGPFFLTAGYIAPHTPYCVPKRYWDRYDRNALPLPPLLRPPEGSPEWAMGDCEPAQFYTQNGYDLPWRPDQDQLRELLHAHFASISYFDAQVGRLLETLRETGLEEETVVVVTTDHGFHDGEHGYWGKHNLWDRSMQVPFLLRVPGRTDGGSSIPAMTEHVDLYPTLCDLCRIPVPGFLEGTSLLPLLLEPDRPWKDAVFAHRKPMWHDRIKAYEMGDSIRTGRFRFTRYGNADGSEVFRELFDYERDPLESRNLAGDPEYREAEEDLFRRLRAGWRSARPQVRP